MIHRFIENQITRRVFKGKVIIIYGPRQAGKTTLVEMILEGLGEPVVKFNGDEPDIRESLSKATSTQLKSMIGKNKIVFIDEAQRISQIGIALKLIHDNIKDVQVIATGSSSFELANLTQEPLTGRKYEFYLLPLSFRELSDQDGILNEKRLVQHRMIFGYYPEIVIKQTEEKELLKLLSDSYLYKDLLNIGSIKKPTLLENIVKALSLQIGNEVTYHELGKLVGADNQTIERYIDLLEKAFIVFKLPAYNRNLRTEIKKGKKIYFYDNGIRNAIIRNFNSISLRTDIGALWENFLVSERRKLLLYTNSDKQPYFWRTTQQQEIDYLEEEIESGIEAWEFKWNSNKAKLPETFSKNYPLKNFNIINNTNFENFLLDL